jgi:hypothetical protein
LIYLKKRKASLIRRSRRNSKLLAMFSKETFNNRVDELQSTVTSNQCS